MISKTHQNTFYLNNPIIHKARRIGTASSAWVRQFDCSDLSPLIICRGPIRKETMDVLEEMGINKYGILLSEKDSINYIHALAPELRHLTDNKRVHRVPDYTGADKAERKARIQQIISIAKDNHYDSIFAGYGFMAEDEALVLAIEEAGLTFIGPCSTTVRKAGLKDEAKRTALKNDVSVTPGIDNLTALTLINKAGNADALKALSDSHDLNIDTHVFHGELLDIADAVLDASYKKGIDIITIEDIGAQATHELMSLFAKHPNNRMRLKAIGGGGGKGQRILSAPASFDASSSEARVRAAAERAPEMVREALNEVKATGIGDNKNVLIELNIETTRHQEIQVIGNGDWSLSMGARDCSLQMHEQKLLEVSQTQEMLNTAIERCDDANVRHSLQSDLNILEKMEAEAERFGQAVALDSVSTFECIVDRDNHFFMEMNTRIQVEHRVTELCYALKFQNPSDDNDYFIIDSLVEAMVLLAKHKKRLPKPTRVPRYHASVEARLNTTNSALKPHAGGTIDYWSDPLENEIRDDQGISLKNPDTGVFMKYHLAGAYDSNIALILTHGETRHDSYQRLAEILRRTTLRGESLETNLNFHYGLVHWFLAEGVHAKSSTMFTGAYLALVGRLREEAQKLDLQYAYTQCKAAYKNAIAAAHGQQDTLVNALKAADDVIERKHTLLLRPLEILLSEPHQLSGWLSLNKSALSFGDNGEVLWNKNPWSVLEQTYHYLDMDFRAHWPSSLCIWKSDNEILQSGVTFYQSLEQRLSCHDYADLDATLNGSAPSEFTEFEWSSIQGAHSAYQAGLQLLDLLAHIANRAGFYDLTVNDDLSVHIPETLLDSALQDDMSKVLAPPPATKADEVLAICGGMFYAREAPELPPLVAEGQHFNEGDPLYIIEVMKMFNKVQAPFSGTIDKVLIDGSDGCIVKQGQALFKVTPDIKMKEEDPADIQARLKSYTADILAKVL